MFVIIYPLKSLIAVYSFWIYLWWLLPYIPFIIYKILNLHTLLWFFSVSSVIRHCVQTQETLGLRRLWVLISDNIVIAKNMRTRLIFEQNTFTRLTFRYKRACGTQLNYLPSERLLYHSVKAILCGCGTRIYLRGCHARFLKNRVSHPFFLNFFEGVYDGLQRWHW